MTTPPLRVAFVAVFLRVLLVTFAIQEFTAFNKTRHVLRHAHFSHKFTAFLNFTPYALVLGLLVAALVTVGFDLLVRLVSRPIAALWYSPARCRSENTPLAFQLAPNEFLLAETPARMRCVKGWRAGTLVLTNRICAFYPLEWDRESWQMPRPEIRRVDLRPSRPLLGSFIEGVPEQLLIGGADARPACFAVSDPEYLRDWFQSSANQSI